jgi:hypothetical protein
MKFNLRFDIIDAAREALYRIPFEPFNLRLHSGEILKISNPDFFTVTFSGRLIYDAGKGLRMLNPTLIASIDYPTTATRKKK